MSKKAEVAELLLRPPDNPTAKIVVFSRYPLFDLTSGQKSVAYIDCRKLQSLPETRERIVDHLDCLLKKVNFTPKYLAAIANGGILPAAWIATRRNLPMVTVRIERKTHGLKQLIEGVIMSKKNYLVVEDVFFTGSSTLAGVAELRSRRCKVSHTLSIATYGWPDTLERFIKAKIKPLSLTDLPTVLTVAKELKYTDQKILTAVENWYQNRLSLEFA